MIDFVVEELSTISPSISTLLQVIEDAGTAVLTLTEGLTKQEFLASRLTRAETRRQLNRMSKSASLLASEIESDLLEIDWEGWRALNRRLNGTDKAEDTLLWLAVCALTPNTIQWLRVYRHNQLL